MEALMMPPLSKFLVGRASPEARRQLAAWNLDLSVLLTPPALVVTVIHQTAGMVILMAVSFYAITVTAFDALATSDVRVQQEEDSDAR